jgi:predicted DsbA family dithiol-disulfide isomerase
MIKSSLDELAKIEDIEVTWKSFELRPLYAPPMPPDQEQAYKERIAAAWPRTSQMARDHFGVEMKHHRWGIKSRLALEGAKYAEAQGVGEAYHQAMFKAHFIEDRDFGDLQILADLAVEVGLNRAEFIQAIESGAYAQQVDTDVAQAHAYGINGVPAALIQQKYLVSGAQPLEALQNIAQQVKSREQATY